ncbi:hypothetical protein BGZ80_001141 [Entomortierella chlamydospora]|uniref:Uncharacterized protein n=1 Tax=Entomortierella chlamydospora TaxID=101097 RepID=A0A9P6MS91_9FUNG|nr:hypothetical protein BGZ79_008224 [Entomortierella chlamydospora]KAG0010844.1 hypothetical protein BGZ80_001141 [Entomortierella chlamydospora]
MIPPKRSTATTKRTPSPSAHDESSAKRARSSKTKNKTAPKQQAKEKEHDDDNIKAEPSEDTTQVNDSSKKSAAHRGGSPKSDTVKAEPDDDHIKTEDAEPTASTELGGKVKSEPSNEAEIKQRVIEKGNAFFFYRPKLGVDKPSSAQDVQRLFMLLTPDDATGHSAANNKDKHRSSRSKSDHPGQPLCRLLIIPQKTLPSPGKGPRSRVWAFVGEVSSDLKEVEGKLEQYTYSTKTRGKREQKSARLVAEARYNILLDERNHSRFVYNLEVPEQPGDVQQEFNISKEGQFVIQVKNPEIQTAATERGEARYATLGKSAAKLPKHLQEKFRGSRKEWVRHTSLDSVEFLDIRHVEIMLIAVNKDAKEEFEEVMRALEAEVEENETDKGTPEDQAYKDLGLEEDKVPSAVEEFK